MKTFLSTAAALVGLTLCLPAPLCAQSKENFTRLREKMVEDEIVVAGIRDPRVIDAIRKTPRHEFLPLAQRKYAYFDMALPIGESQTISSPFIVAYMTEQLEPKPTDKVLEIGTGSGYQAAVLSGLVREVYSIEIVQPLGQKAAKTLKQLGYSNVFTLIGDGYKGWPEHAPFDKIIVTCSPENVPEPLVAQLKEGGRMVIPLGERFQQGMYLLQKQRGKLVTEKLTCTLFVPMTGQAEAKRQIQPDGTRPELRNGDFEETISQPPVPDCWYYQRQLELVSEADAPRGKNYVLFRNSTPGRPAQALQGFAVDGRKIRQLEVSFKVRGKELRPGVAPNQFPRMMLLFYDDDRVQVGEAAVGGWRDTFNWTLETRRVPVPQKARECIMQIGLLGALGEIAYDAIEVRGLREPPEKKPR